MGKRIRRPPGAAVPAGLLLLVLLSALGPPGFCLLFTSYAAAEPPCVDLGGVRVI